ncbi:GPP34 family phosphoprotein [Cellulomonas sp. PhB150]|uniref:GOLPH3/VPS74 family protein n=1 Tax=Cellulomonas sp. PhB150 TaxID=2485188 RepID=UPI000F46D283|nr:GPP34 family phosphoprotein [Cellulomonas sp. PhB150]ROS26041.1 Golgi phosphoprotein 3 GPP34 [Cellulomonas sp. PhB150]
MLIAEDLALLLTDDESGRPTTSSQRVDLALAGGLLLELLMTGRVAVAGAGHPAGKDRVVILDPAPTGDPVLDEAVARLAEKPRKAKDALPRLTKDLRPALLDRLTRNGLLRLEESKILGLFPTRAHLPGDEGYERSLRAAVHDVLVVGRTPTEREVAVVSVLQSVDQVPRVLGEAGVPARELRRRAKALAEGEAVGVAVRQAIQAMDGAMTAVMVATTAVVVAGSG